MQTKLTTSQGFNPYQLNGKTIEKIIFFNDGRELCSVRWFGSNNEYPELIINEEIKRKNAIDLTGNKPYYTTIKTGFDAGRLFLFIPSKLVNLIELGESVKYDNEDETQYIENYQISVECSKWEFKLKEGGEKGNGDDYTYIKSPIDLRNIKFDKWTRNVSKDKKIREDELQKEIKENTGVDLKIWDLKNILKGYSITKLTK